MEQVYKPRNNDGIIVKEKNEEKVIPQRNIQDSSENKELIFDSDESKKEVLSEMKEKLKEEINEDLVVEQSKRVKTGIKGFDELIQGGFEKNSNVLIVGAAGTGKTLFGMQFLFDGIKKFNENGVFISFEEDKDSLFSHAKQFGWDFKKFQDEKKFRLIQFKPHQVTKIIEEGGAQIKDVLTEINAKRIVIDSITAYGLLFRDEYERREKILEFFNLLGKWGITSLIIAEDSPEELESEEGSIAFISDAVVSMYYHHDEEKGIRIHSLEVLKMRGTKHTNKICAIDFEENGLRVYPDVEVF